MKTALIALTLLFANSILAQRIIHVSPLGSDTTRGETWELAVSSLERAIEIANENDEIWLATGVYTPSSNSTSASFKITKNIAIYGGFSGNETYRFERDPHHYMTMLSGEIGKMEKLSDNCNSVVEIHNANVTIDGISIVRGNAYTKASLRNSARSGGGMYITCINDTCNVILNDIYFRENSAREGGAIYATAEKNGALLLSITECKFYNNKAGIDGGAIYLDGVEDGVIFTIVKNCEFKRNYSMYGGGIMTFSTKGRIIVKIINTSFIENEALVRGGGIYNLNNGNAATITLDRVFFDKNVPDIMSKYDIAFDKQGNIFFQKVESQNH